MRRIVLPAFVWALAVLALLGGLALMALGRWNRPLLEADAAVQEGRLPQALEGYAQSEKRFDQLATVKRMVPEGYEASVANQLALQYRLAEYDQLLEKAATAPSMAATHFWAGCALFAKARAEEEPDAIVGWLTQAEQEFHDALKADPDDWNTKYNFELTSRVLSELKKSPQAPPKQLLQLLRPQPKMDREPRKIG